MSDSKVELVTFVPEVKPNEYDATVEDLAEAPENTAAAITVATGDVSKHATRFAKAANAAGFGARKRAVVDNGDGTSTLTFTLGKIRQTKPAAE